MLPSKPIEFLGASRRALVAFRVVHVVKFADAVYVLHAFKKKSRKTSRLDIELARSRYVELMKKRTP